MDKKTGKAIKVNGKEVTATASFVAGGDAVSNEKDTVVGDVDKDAAEDAIQKTERVSGEATVTFKFDASGLGGKTLVAFEHLYAAVILVIAGVAFLVKGKKKEEE